MKTTIKKASYPQLGIDKNPDRIENVVMECDFSYVSEALDGMSCAFGDAYVLAIFAVIFLLTALFAFIILRNK